MALATVVHVEYSSYRRSGARMLITEDGSWIGGVSGGCLEGDTLKKALYAIHKNEIVKVTYDTRDDDPSQIGIGLGCNGLIDVLIVPIIEKDNPIEVLKKVIDRRIPSTLVTSLLDGNTKDYTYNSCQNKLLSKYILDAQSKIKSCKIDLDEGYFIEIIPPEIVLFVFGKNYDVIPLAKITKNIGWKIKVIANPQKTSKDIYNLADEVLHPSKPLADIDYYSAALLMSHDYKTDKENLIKLQAFDLKYIGLLGPKKRKDKMLDELQKVGVTIITNNLYGPMGLDTGANSPEEIAVSILAEIRCCFEDREGGRLRDRQGHIHN